MPCADRPSRCACSSTSTAIEGSQPNLRDSGHSAPAPSHRMRQNTFAPGRNAGDLLDFGLAVDREQAHAKLKGARNITLLLDGVAIGDAVRSRAGREHHLDLGDRGGVEAGAERGEQREHLRRGIRLHRVEHAGVRQSLGEGTVIVAHDIEIDHQHGPSSERVRRKLRIRSVMVFPKQPRGRARTRPGECRMMKPRYRAMEDTINVVFNTGQCCLGLEGKPHRTPGNEGQASSVT